jgi:hypothetical protein
LNQFDIKVESREKSPAGAMEQRFEAEMHRRTLLAEQTMRTLAAPYLRAGYLPSELVAVERLSDWFADGERQYISVKPGRERSPLRLWLRRTLTRLGLRGRQYRCEVLPWHG